MDDTEKTPDARALRAERQRTTRARERRRLTVISVVVAPLAAAAIAIGAAIAESIEVSCGGGECASDDPRGWLVIGGFVGLAVAALCGTMALEMRDVDHAWRPAIGSAALLGGFALLAGGLVAVLGGAGPRYPTEVWLLGWIGLLVLAGALGLPWFAHRRRRARARRG